MQWTILILCIATSTVLPVLGFVQSQVASRAGSSSCSAGYVKCAQGEKVDVQGEDCIHTKYVCDGTQHCTDGSDEDQELCSAWTQELSAGLCGQGKMRCGSNCYNTKWDGCHNSRCSSEIRSGGMCKIVKDKELPPSYRGLELASKSRERRNVWSNNLDNGQQSNYFDDEDLFEGSAEGSGIDVNDQDIETVEMLATAVKSQLSETECPMLYIKMGNHCVSFFSLAQVPWPEARQFCQSIHGDLLTIEDIHMYTGLLDYLREKDLSSDFWLGGRYDMDLNNWCWLDDTPMPSKSPYWALQYSSTCQSRSPGGKYFNYIQSPEQHTQGYCAAITYEKYFYISDEKCSLRKSPLCLFDLKKLNQNKVA